MMPSGQLSRGVRNATREARRLTRDICRVNKPSRWDGDLQPTKRRHVASTLSQHTLRPLHGGYAPSVSFLGVGSTKKDAEALRLESLYAEFARLKLEKAAMACDFEPARARSETPSAAET